MGMIINPYRFAVANTPPACISDGNTVGWYIADDLTTITKDGGNLVAQWNDKLGSGHDLLQSDDTKKPVWSASGITFDGSNDYMQSAFTLNNGCSGYMVLNVLNYVATNKYLVDGITTATYALYQNTLTKLYLYGFYNDEFTTGSLHILRGVVKSGTNASKLIVDNGTTFTGSNYSNLGGITLASKGDGTSCCNVLFREVIFRKVVDNSTDETSIYNYLATKYSIS